MSQFNRPRPQAASFRNRRRSLFAAAFEGLEPRRLLAVVGITANDSTAAEASLATGKFRFTRDDTEGALTVDFAITGTATNGADYNTVTESVSFIDGAATADVTITPKEDASFEGSETVIAIVSESADYTIDEDATDATITLADNDKPAVSITASDATATEAEVEEDITTGTFTITRTGSTAASLAVKVTIAGTGTNGTDYETLTTTVTIPEDESSVVVDLTPKDDSTIEAPETVIVTLATDAAYTFTAGATATATVTITDDEVPTVIVAAADAAAIEGSATDTGKFTFTRNGPTTAALTVNYAMSGVGVNGTDYDTATGSVVIAVGKATADVIVKTKQDTSVEGVETAIITVSDAMAYDLDNTKKTATVSITDDDKPVISLTASDATAVETGNNTNAAFTLTRTGVPTTLLTVPVVITGTATKGSDYKSFVTNITIPAGKSSVLIKIKAKDDETHEGAETVILTLGVGTTFLVDSTAKTATVTIADDEVPEVKIVATDATATEPTTDKAAFTVTRTGPTTTALTVNYVITGTATNGTDMDTVANSVVIPIGKASATIAVNPKDDELLENPETLILTISDSANYDADPDDDAATASIRDNEKPLLEITIDAAEVTEEDVANDISAFRFSRSGAPAEEMKVPITVTGTAGKTGDYVASYPAFITFAAGASTAMLEVRAVNDSAVEGDETIIVTMGTGATYFLGSNKTQTVTNVDDDLPTVTIAGTDLAAAEPTDKASFTLTRNGPTKAALTVAYTVSGTATSDDDYTALTGTAIIPVGKTSVVVDVVAKEDATLEGKETVIITLDDEEGDAPYILDSSKDDVTVNIADNEKPVVSIVTTDATIEENPDDEDELATGVLTIARTGPTTESLEVLYTVTGTGVAGTDTMATLPGKITFSAGQASKTITLTGDDDDNYEGSETIIVTLKAAATLYTIHSTDKAATATVADDDKPMLSIRATAATGKEKAGAMTVTVTRDGATTGALVVALDTEGTAVAGDVVALPTTVTILAGKAFSVVTITAKDDTTYEGTETVSVVVIDDEDETYAIDGDADTATVSITDDDLPTISITASDANGTEVSNGTGAFTITRTIAAADPITVNLGLTGNAKNGKDYNALGKTVTIPAGQASVVVTVTPKTDSTVEGPETVILGVNTGTGYAVHSTNKSGTVTIADAQTPEVGIAANDAAVDEDDEVGTWFRISRNGRTLSSALVVQIELTGTAVDEDFVAKDEDGDEIDGGAITIPAGEAYVDIYFAPVDNDDAADDKTIILTLAEDDAYEIDADANEDTVTITDDD